MSSNDHPLVSVIIPTKDRRELLLETLASVQAQTWQNWEAVVVDDLSTDDTWATLLEVSGRDPRIRPIRRTGPAGGAPVARNQGFAASRGEFVVFLDSDDLLTPAAIATRLQAASAHPEADAIVFQAEHFTIAPGGQGSETVYRNHVFDGVDPLDTFLAYHAPWYTSGPLWRRAAVDRVGPWDIELPFSQDLEYHIRALLAGVCFLRFTQVDQYIRGHQGPKVSRRDDLQGMSHRIALLDKLIAQLQARNMLTRRRKHMLAWSAFWGTMGYVHSRSLFSGTPALTLWRAARGRGLISAPAYAGGCVVFSRRMKLLSRIASEIARLVFYNHLKRRHFFHPGLLCTFRFQVKWALQRRRLRRQAILA